MYLARLALAYAKAAEPEQGAHFATRALAVAYDTESARTLAEPAVVNKAMEAWSHAPVVTSFRERLRVVHTDIASRAPQSGWGKLPAWTQEWPDTPPRALSGSRHWPRLRRVLPSSTASLTRWPNTWRC
ncbi:hypothetical protein FHU37_002811 [Allostreptomyces psammosilenae]|uniref:Uncharacterized protein n=1 Tax=Allostreptomyces psammosilenae TaxID=1892865 RepID=A0A853A5R2_9ACTN|nr:hypothetical protein [Allostreptomyces psammosilenae]